MNFFFDRCFPGQLFSAVAALEADSHVMQYHDNHFQKTTTDVE
jgi:hypothetical protein